MAIKEKMPKSAADTAVEAFEDVRTGMESISTARATPLKRKNAKNAIPDFSGEMVLLSGIEPPTSPLPRGCSTTELQQHWCLTYKTGAVEEI